MGQKVVMCSPLTLFAFLGVIRQAFDNFMIEQTSEEILQAARHVQHAVAQVRRPGRQGEEALRGVDKEFEALAGTRRRALERPLAATRGVRLQKGLPVDGELFSLPDGPDDDTDTPPGGTVRQIGA